MVWEPKSHRQFAPTIKKLDKSAVERGAGGGSSFLARDFLKNKRESLLVGKQRGYYTTLSST